MVDVIFRELLYTCIGIAVDQRVFPSKVLRDFRLSIILDFSFQATGLVTAGCKVDATITLHLLPLGIEIADAI